MPTEEEKAAQANQETESQEEESKSDDNGFDPLNRKLGIGAVAVKTDRKNMETQKNFDYTRGGYR